MKTEINACYNREEKVGMNCSSEIDDDIGISPLLIHTDSDRMILKKLLDNLVYRRCSSDDIIKHNACVEGVVRLVEQDVFFKGMSVGDDFDKLIYDLMRKPLGHKIKRRLEMIHGGMHIKDIRCLLLVPLLMRQGV